MNSREAMAETTRIAAERNWEKGGHLEEYLFTLFTAREDARNLLISAISAVQHDLDRLNMILHQPSPLLNSLGELQQRPAAVEAAVGAFSAASRNLDTYLKVFSGT